MGISIYLFISEVPDQWFYVYGFMFGLGFCINKSQGFSWRGLFVALLMGMVGIGLACIGDPHPSALPIAGLMMFVCLGSAYQIGKKIKRK